ncbi:Late embryogenesis abundant (LEA) hydroxyproline-rich glycoprotein family [Quillaja saponaria]|uniref:Late embryogenesis abundant (LEA) hydroxyproline-rich glycoprotein family n=1 Tax=Quillaja saponaria TaxID=32244 RepID=A0AAD7PYR3_QUISA|nr:Late embryogenesis abundant (LEA) hydroxyproline-rich glycoprotein family [Quillaja saponaria]
MPSSHSSSSSNESPTRRKESGAEPSSVERSHVHPPPPQPTTGQYPPPGNYLPPHMMGYPPAMGYPPHPQYVGYPPHGYPYPQNQPLPPAYYATQPGYQSSSSGFFRSFIICSTLILVLFFTISLMLSLVLHPQLPNFKVDALFVSNLNTSNSNLTANWDANITVENPNKKLKAYFTNVQTNMYHNEDIVSVIYASPFELDTKQTTVVNVKLTTNPSNQVMVARWVVDEMAKERGTGTVTFNLRMQLRSEFKSGELSSRGVVLRVFCEDLEVQFQGTTGNGALNYNGGKSKDCIVYY